MPQWLKIIFRAVLGFALLIILLWIALIAYIETHKQQILNKITAQVNEHIHGTLTIGDIEPSLWRGFPGISVALKDVSLRDSLWQQHHHSLLEAKRIFVKLNSLRLFSRRLEIDRVTARDGQIYLFTDSTGYSNTYLLKKRDTTAQSKPGRFSFEFFTLENMRFVLENKTKYKLFDIGIKKMDGQAKKEEGIWHLLLDTKADVHEFCFNTGKGSFLKNAGIYADLSLLYDADKKRLTIPEQPVSINDQNLLTSGHFDFSNKPAAFDLQLRSDKAYFSHVIALLSPNISSKLDSITLTQSVKLTAHISGLMKFRDTPLIHVDWQVANNTLGTPAGDFTDCSFSGYYSNEVIKGNGHNDPNSQIVLRNVSAKWNNIPFRADTVCVTNLKKPVLAFNLHTDAPLNALNNTAAKMPFEFKSGRLQLDMHYDGPLSKKTDSTATPNIAARGFIRDATFTYLPRSLSFTHANAILELDGDNLAFRDMVMQKNRSVLHMEGTALHIFRFYFDNPQKVLINWHIRSPLVNLGDFLTFVGKRKRNAAMAAQQHGRGNKATQIFSQLDKVLDAADVNLELNVDRLYIRRFVADHVYVKAAMTATDIVLSQVRADHAGGVISLSARISQSERNNPFSLTADVRNVAVDKIFYGFENFGQDAIDAKNVRGNLSAKAVVSGQMTEGAKIINQSLYGYVDYTLHNGALINFEPLLKINKFFRKRDLSNIQIRDLTGKLGLEGKKIIIAPLQIISSALYLNVAGVYAPPSGTDIQLELPLRNPKKDELEENDPNSIVAPARRGLVLYLRAQDGPDGKVKIGWDPAKKTVIPAKDFGRKRRLRDSLNRR